MPAIKITNVQKSFNRIPVLKEVSIEIAKGEMVALIGSSGSGKSTLIRHLSGLTFANRNAESQVEVLGQSVQKNGRPAKELRATRARIGNVFQQFNLVNRLSVQTNVLIGALSRIPSYRSLLGWFTQEEKLKALQALDLVGLREHALKRASDLSGGQQQRVAIARALMQEAEVILADEPIASLDPESSRQVMETLLRINREMGITVVVTLHQVEYAQKYCNRAIALKEGEVYFDGPIESLDSALLTDLYGTYIPEGTQSSEANELPQKLSDSDLIPEFNPV